jgi:hypothetical protein
MTVANWRRRREHSLPPPTPGHQRSRKRVPKPDRRRALELLASCPEGCTETIMLAHGFTIEQMVDLVRAGLASATAKRIIAGSREMEVATVRITDAGDER